MKPDAQIPESIEADAALELFFAPAREAAPASADLMARILRDAAEVSGAQTAPVFAVAEPPARRGLFAGLIAALGGWPVLGGMVTATMAGVWLGFTTPALLDPASLTASAYSFDDLMPSVELAMADLDWTE